MGWFKKLLGFAAVVGAAFLTFGGSLAAAGAWLTSGSVGAMVARTVLSIGLSKLIANRAGTKAAGGDAPSARFQLRPSTTNKVPLIYGSGYYGAVMTDAIISTDNTTMWYVMACAEVPDTGSISFGSMYLDNRLVTFDGTDQTKVVSLTNNAGQVDDKISGNMFIYKYSNGSSSGVNTAQTAIQILQNSAIPVDRRWTSTNTMDDTAFVIVKLIFNTDKQVTGLGELKFNMINTITKPGDVFLDYLQNSRYGCSIPVTQIDTASFTALNTYSDELITYTPVGGGTATQARYRINGPIDLSTNCLSNLQSLADACDSWIQYSELTGQWKVVMNKPYIGDLEDLYSVDSSVLIGGIDITPLDLNQTYNSIEVQYPAGAIKDQTDVKVIDLTDPTTAWYNPSLLSPNEPNNRLTIQYQIVNNYVQATYLGVRRLLQSREDLVINCNLDYSGIQIEAGDVVRVTLAEYGWTDKLFRVSTVTEIKKEDGNLGASIVAFEYNDTIYDDQALLDYVPADNTGLTDPSIFSIPGTPTIATNPLSDGNVKSFKVTTTVPTEGAVLYMDFNYGTSSNVATHKLFTSASTSDGSVYAPGTTVSIDAVNLPPATYYWSATARNQQAGRISNSSSGYGWGGPGITTYNPATGLGGITYDQINATSISGIRRIISGVNWSIPVNSTGNILLPVPVSSTTTNVPVIVPVAFTSYTYPAVTGDSLDTAGTSGRNYYAASSTGAGAPLGSWFLQVASSEDNWWAILNDSWTANTIKSTETAYMSAGFTVVPSVDGTVIQFIVGSKEGTNTYYTCDTTKLATATLEYANAPYQINQTITFSPGNNITGGALMLRVIYGGDVGIVSGTFATSASTNPYV